MKTKVTENGGVKVTETGIVIPMPKRLSKMQKTIVNKMISMNAWGSVLNYFQSFNGKYTSRNDAKFIKYEYLVKGKDDYLKAKKSNGMVTLFNQLFRTDRGHVPYTLSKDFVGVEIECFIPCDSVIPEGNMTDCDVCDGAGDLPVYDDSDNVIDRETCEHCGGSGRVRSNYHRELRSILELNKIKTVCVKSDGSIRAPANYFPVELTVLTSLKDMGNLKKLCSLLSKLGTKVNNSCGLHVHLDHRHSTRADVRAVGKKFNNALPLLLKCVPESRRVNDYCRPRVSATDRYSAVNLCAFSSHRTIEIRLHSGTTSFNKIAHWITILSAINRAEKLTMTVDSVNRLTDFVYLPEETIEYVENRIQLFSGGANVAVETMDNDVA